eukprot:420563-Prymnesium_polylepis.1
MSGAARVLWGARAGSVVQSKETPEWAHQRKSRVGGGVGVGARTAQPGEAQWPVLARLFMLFIPTPFAFPAAARAARCRGVVRRCGRRTLRELWISSAWGMCQLSR